MQDLSIICDVLRYINPDEVKDFSDSISATQYASKNWLVEKLVDLKRYHPGSPSILTIGGWYGSYLIPFLQEAVKPKKIYHTDKNMRAVDVASFMHRSISKNCEFMCLNAETSAKRITSIEADIIINTSCEHMYDMSNIMSSNSKCLYVFQSCNVTSDPGHINPSFSIQEFKIKCGLTRVLFEGEMQVNSNGKTRYMVMGFKQT